MDINYFLFLKKKYESIIFLLNDIIKEYDEINELNEIYVYDQNENDQNQNQNEENQNFQNLQNELYTELNNYIFELNKNEVILLDINNKIKEICQHEFVEDYIDISPDESKLICYCKICQYSKPC